MKHLILLLSLVFCFTANSYAVTAVTTVNNTTSTTTIASEIEKGLFSKVKSFVAKKVNDVKKAIGLNDDTDILMLVCIWFIPPLAVYLYEGKQWTKRVTINLILTLLCGLPGVIHAAVVILGKK